MKVSFFAHVGLLAAVLTCASSSAQSTTDSGFPTSVQSPFGSYDGSTLVQVSLTNQQASIHHSFLKLPQRQGFHLGDLNLVYTPPTYTLVQSCSYQDPDDGAWNPQGSGETCNGGWEQLPGIFDLVGNQGPLISRDWIIDAAGRYLQDYYSVSDGYQSKHTFVHASDGYHAADGSGWFMSDDLSTVKDSEGTAFTLEAVQGNLWIERNWTKAVNLHGDTVINEATTYKGMYSPTNDSLGRTYTRQQSDLGGCGLGASEAWLLTIASPVGSSIPIALKLCYASVTIKTDFGGYTGGYPNSEYLGMGEGLESIILPDGRKWEFLMDQYTNAYANGANVYSTGLLSTVILPTGASIQIAYDTMHDPYGTHQVSDAFPESSPTPVTSVTVDPQTPNGKTRTGYVLQTETYYVGTPWKLMATLTRSDANGNVVESEKHHIDQNQNDASTTFFDAQGNLQKTINRTYETVDLGLDRYYRYAGAYLGYTPQASYLVNESAVWPDGTSCSESHSYGPYLSYFEPYAAGTASFGSELSTTVTPCSDYAGPGSYRHTETTPLFAVDSSVYGQNRLGDQYSVEVFGSNGKESSERFSHAGNGDLLSQTQVDFPTNADRVTTFVYDSHGHPTQRTDPRGNTSTYTYDDQDQFVVSETSGGLTNQWTHEPNTGVLLEHIDPNGYSRIADYYPDFRIRSVSERTGAVLQEFTYTANTQQSKLYQDSGTAVATTSTLDGLGRVIETSIDSATPSPIRTDTQYDALGRVASVTNPYYTQRGSAPMTTYNYDIFGRKTFQYPPLQATPKKWSYAGNWVDEWDEATVHTRYHYDSNHNLVAVVEGADVNPLSTTYQYDGRGNLTHVTQNGLPGFTDSGFTKPEVTQNRTFSYDAFSELLSSTNPETGTICYGSTGGQPASVNNCTSGYDANGNLLYKTDANGMTISYTYDALNRMLTKWAPDGYPMGHFVYDQGANSRGRLWLEYIDGAAGTMYSYDRQGRVTGTQWFDYAHGAWQPGMGPVTHDLAGNVTQLSYPNGTVLNQTWDGAGRLQSVTDATPGGPGTVYFGPTPGASQYTPSGALAQATLGNGVVEQAMFNSRLQPCHLRAESPVQSGGGITLDPATGMGILLDRQLFYSQAGEPNCGVASGNNGNIWHIGEENSGQQNFTYDVLNRLTSAYSANRVVGPYYNFTYQYDSFGNMLPLNNVTGFGPYSTDPATNRMLNGADLTYYPNGNLATSNGHYFWYTAEGYIRSIDAYTTGSYLYNAQGQRTLSVRNDRGDHSNFSASENVYLGGQPVAEYHIDSASSPWTWTNYVYANGQKIARLAGTDPTAPAVNYYLDDQLGTAQMELDATGTPTWSGWYTPFGQEITSGWASNFIGNQSADGTSMRYKFTGKERDTESGLDYFGARYYASSMGRWVSPDWAEKPEAVPYSSLDNPQSLNLYGFVGNNPLSKADLDGHQQCSCGLVPPPQQLSIAAQDALDKLSALGSKLMNALPTIVITTVGAEGVHQLVLNAKDTTPAAPATSAAPAAPAAPGTQTASPAVPTGLVGVQDGKGGPSGSRVNSGPLAPEHGGTGNATTDFGHLTGGNNGPAPQGSRLPPGTQVGENGTQLRPPVGYSGPRIDIPANGPKPIETLHYPKP